jgi:choline dehydrogenase-like flavoprotein
MIEEFTHRDDRAHFDADVCIVGAGAAGITLARRLAARGVDVLMLESGAADFEKPLQDLGAGESVGFTYYPLDQSRLRLFGGTTAVWGGRVVQLDPIDFERRPWIDHSGWPFGKETLAPYYAEALRSLDLELTEGNEDLWERLQLRKPDFDADQLRTSFFQFDEQFERFTLRRCDDLVGSGKVRILLRATVLEIRANAEGGAIESVQIGNLSGGRGIVWANAFVLAAGGLENPRLLLNSRGVHPEGLGNQHDLVGRFFMEHPHARGARVFPRRLWPFLKHLTLSHRRDGLRYAPLVRASEQLQEREGVLNSAFTFSVRPHQGNRMPPGKWLFNTLKWKVPHDHRGRSVWWFHRRAKRALGDRLGLWTRWYGASTARRGVYVVARAEQAPNPASRVLLSEKRDAFGLPRTALDWRFSDVDKRSLHVLMKALDSELTRLDLGRAEPSPWLEEEDMPWEMDPLISNHPIGGYHHMGTTRMAASERDGVVDADGRVHGIANLYVAGSSVFPTGGWANPTLTILALALRLGDHLSRSVHSLPSTIPGTAPGTASPQTATPSTAAAQPTPTHSTPTHPARIREVANQRE